MELHWWLKEIPKAYANIHFPKLNFVIHTDASQTGWGASDGNNQQGQGFPQWGTLGGGGGCTPHPMIFFEPPPPHLKMKPPI